MKNTVVKETVQRLLLAVALICVVSSAVAQQSLFLRDYPEAYVVQDGDTLWNIASQFLQDPARW